MKHEYTDEALALALVKSGYSKELHYKELRHILSTLPDQTDEWERCEFSDIRKGDRVRAEFIDITYEGTAVDVRDYKIAIGHNRNEILRAWKNPDLYRISAPGQHPSPEKDPKIVVRKTTDDEYRKDIFMQAYGGMYAYVGEHGSFMTFDPNSIIDWSPAAVVAKEEH